MDRYADTITDKQCRKCMVVQPRQNFCTDNSKSDGKFIYCKDCLKQRNAKRTQSLRRAWHLSRKYGLSPEEYRKLLDDQGNCCAICETNPPTGKATRKKNRRFAVDHCHATGKIRGVLCSNCNTLLGLAKDDVSILQKAINYLKSQ
jgi:hypothetical protein